MNSVRSVAAILLALALAAPAFSQPGMPDLRQMSGVPLPVSDVPVGTVTVRVIRGSLSNVVTGQDVQLSAGGATRTGKTNEAGRAEFSGLTPGTRVTAATVVDGQRLESQAFDVPASGGVRLMLVAAAPAGGTPAPPAGSTPASPASGTPAPPAGGTLAPPAGAGPAQPGTIALGDQTRFVFEMGDEALTGFYILQIVNASPAPVRPAEIFTLDLPEGAQGASMMQGSSPQGSVAGPKVVVAGPFAPGQTLVQVAFSLPYTAGDVTVQQRLPVALAQVTLLVEKVGGMQVESSQISQHREIKAEKDTYILGQGPGIEAGGTFSARLIGLPHHPLWPRNMALTLAVLILAVGVWFSVRPGRAAAAESARRRKLSATRDRLFTDLARIEEQRLAGSVDEDRYAARRGELVRALERIYAELDEEAAA